MPKQHTRRIPTTPSLLRMRSRSVRAPWGTRLLAAWVVLSLTFALTPCCEIIGAASAAPASASTDHGHTPDAHSGTHTPDTGDPCVTWIDRSDAVPAKADVVAPSVAKVAITTPFAFLWTVPSANDCAQFTRTALPYTGTIPPEVMITPASSASPASRSPP